MAKDNQISMPGVFGGLMRYNEGFSSSIKLKPTHIIILIILLAASVIALKIFYPVATSTSVGNIPTNIPAPIGGWVFLLFKKK